MPRMVILLLVFSFVSLAGCQPTEPEPPKDAPTIPKTRTGKEHLDNLKRP